MITDRDIVCISSIDWDFIWQGHQQIMSTFAARGNRVLFIENTGVRAPRLGDVSRLRHRLARWWASTKGFRQEAENLYVFSPLIVPLPYSRVARWINRLLLVRALRRWMRVTGFGRPIVWTFLPTPLARDLLSALDPELTVYYCIDDLASSSPQARRVERTERMVLSEVDLVFVTSEKLRQRAAALSSRVHLFPFAVDYARFEAVRDDGSEAPRDISALARPRIGYLGGIHQWIDQALLADVARRMPEVSFALVGPTQSEVEALTGCPNVHLLGPRSHAEVPHYLRAFDVAVVPYRLTEYTAHVYPTKLNEYLAMGLPVVATDLPEIRRFNAEHGDIIRVASSAEEFVGAIRAALGPPAPAEVSRRLQVARENSWDARIERMSDLIEKRIEERRQTDAEGWEQTLRQAYRVALQRLTSVVTVVLLAYLSLFWSPLPWLAARPLRMTAAPVRADAIVVFGGGAGESGEGGEGYQDRVQKAVVLYQAGLARRIVFSTGWTYAFREAELMKALAVSLNVPAAAIVLEQRSGSTYDNVRLVKPILNEHGWRKVLLVSSPYHMRRAVLTFRKVAPDIEVVTTPAESGYYRHRWGASLAQLRGILHEYLAIAYYRWKGWI